MSGEQQTGLHDAKVVVRALMIVGLSALAGLGAVFAVARGCKARPHTKTSAVVIDAAVPGPIASDARPEPPATVQPGLTVSGLSPTLGPVKQWVYVFGSGFVPGETVVEVGGAEAVRGHVYDSSQLGFTVPERASGETVVTVHVGNARASSQQRYRVGVPDGPPAITHFAPASGPPGTWVYVEGQNFNATDTTITFDGVDAAGHCYGPHALWFNIPAGATHSGHLGVRTPKGSAESTKRFELTAAASSDAGH